ncbi:MAG: hypothetical protein ACLFWL_01950 [Candidatus Brocadiia bacterium]
MPAAHNNQSFGPMGEHSLHEQLKTWYSIPDDRAEVPVEGYIIDLVRGGLLIEIQTGNFTALKDKLPALLEGHPVRVVYPLSREKWIVHIGTDGLTKLNRRKSPKHQSLIDIFWELVSIPELMMDPGFILEVIVIQEEAIRRQVKTNSSRKRRKFIPFDRRLLSVEGRRLYEKPADLKSFIPDRLERPFTNAQLARAIGRRRKLAEKITYCLRHMNVLKVVGKDGGAYLHEDCEPGEIRDGVDGTPDS